MSSLCQDVTPFIQFGICYNGTKKDAHMFQDHLVLQWLPPANSQPKHKINPNNTISVKCPNAHNHANPDDDGSELVISSDTTDPATYGSVTYFHCPQCEHLQRLSGDGLELLWPAIEHLMCPQWIKHGDHFNALQRELERFSRGRWPSCLDNHHELKAFSAREQLRSKTGVELWRMFGKLPLDSVRKVRNGVCNFLQASLRVAQERAKMQCDEFYRNLPAGYRRIKDFILDDWALMETKAGMRYINIKTLETFSGHELDIQFAPFGHINFNCTQVKPSEMYREFCASRRSSIIKDVFCRADSVWSDDIERLVMDGAGQLCLNSWRGIDYQPERFTPEQEAEFEAQGPIYQSLARKCAPFIDHIKNLGGEAGGAGGAGDEWQHLLNFLSGTLRHINTKPQFALVHLGGKGIGKGVLYSTFFKVVGEQLCGKSSVKQLLDGWGDYSTGKRFLIVPEIDSGGAVVDSKRLKDLIASDSRVKISNIKHGSIRYEQDNLCLIMTMNDLGWLRIEDDERRYLVIESEHIERDTARPLAKFAEDDDNLRALATFLYYSAPPREWMFAAPPRTKGFKNAVDTSTHEYALALNAMIGSLISGSSGGDASSTECGPFIKGCGILADLRRELKSRLPEGNYIPDRTALISWVRKCPYLEYHNRFFHTLDSYGRTIKIDRRDAWSLKGMDRDKLAKLFIAEREGKQTPKWFKIESEAASVALNSN